MTIEAQVYAGTGASGSTDGHRLTTARFTFLEGLVWATDYSRLFVADNSTGRIRVINPATDQVSTLVTGLNRPEALGIDPNGTHLFLGHVGDASIERININTGARTVVASGYEAANTPRVSPDGAWTYFNGGNSGAGKLLYRMPYPSGAVSMVRSGFSQIEEMYFNPVDGLLYVADFAAGQLVAVDWQNAHDAEVVLTGIGNTNGVTVDSDGIVYVSSRSSGRITTYDPATGDTGTFFSDLNVPNSLDFGFDGSLYVADVTQVKRITEFVSGGFVIGRIAIAPGEGAG